MTTQLLVPVEVVTSPAQFIVTISSTGTVASDIGSMSCDLVGDQALTYVLRIR